MLANIAKVAHLVLQFTASIQMQCRGQEAHWRPHRSQYSRAKVKENTGGIHAVLKGKISCLTRDISCLASLLQLSINKFTAPVHSCNHIAQGWGSRGLCLYTLDIGSQVHISIRLALLRSSCPSLSGTSTTDRASVNSRTISPRVMLRRHCSMKEHVSVYVHISGHTSSNEQQSILLDYLAFTCC